MLYNILVDYKHWVLCDIIEKDMQNKLSSDFLIRELDTYLVHLAAK